jgi:PAS domain S-box-containing protein
MRSRQRGNALIAAPLSRQLRRLAALLAPTLLIALGLLAAYQWQQELQQLQRRQDLLARVLADQVTRSIDGAALASAQLVNQLEQESAFDSPSVQQRLNNALSYLHGVRSLALVDASGRVLASTSPAEFGLRLPPGILFSGAPRNGAWLGPVRAGRGLADLLPGRGSPRGLSFLPLMQSIVRPGQAGVTLVTLLSTDPFATFQVQTLGSSTMVAALLQTNGQMVASAQDFSEPDGLAWQVLEPFRRFLPAQESGAWEGRGLSGSEQIASFRMSRNWPLLAIVESSRADALQQWWRDSRNLLLFCGGAGLLLLAALLLAARSQAERERALLQRDRAEATVSERDEALAAIIGSLQEAVFRTDSLGALSFISAQAEQLTGMSVDHLVGKPIWDWVDAPQRRHLQALFDCEPGDDALRLAHVTLRATVNAPQRPVDICVRPLWRDGALIGFAGSAVDASARVQAERRLVAQLASMQQLMEVSPLPTSVFDIQRRYTFVNQAWERFAGRSAKDVIGQRVGTGLDEAQRAVHEAMDQELLASGRPVRYGVRLRRTDGALRDVIVNKLLLPGDEVHSTRIMAVLVDVTELRDAERATREARDAAEASSRAKSEFIANVSHELRTPLQAIIGFSELGLMRVREQPRVAAMFDDIHMAGQRMLTLVNDLLDVAKLDSAMSVMHFERIDLRPLLEGSLRELKPLSDARQLHLRLQVEDRPLPLQADPARLHQVVRNVLANAIKFSPPGSEIHIDAAAVDAEQLEIRVSDQGPGIPPTELEAIFDAFAQSSATQDGSGGTGLGLTISRKIVAAHAGRIWAENAASGGACFRIRLPMAAAQVDISIDVEGGAMGNAGPASGR